MVKALAAQGCKVAADEPGTLAYEFHYSPGDESLVILETYADSAAHLAHMSADGFGEYMGSLMALVDSAEFVVLGEPAPEHAAALSTIPGVPKVLGANPRHDFYATVWFHLTRSIRTQTRFASLRTSRSPAVPNTNPRCR